MNNYHCRAFVAVVLGVLLQCGSCYATSSTISSNFNGTAIAGGNYIWFNSVISPGTGFSGQNVTIYVTNSEINGLPSGKLFLPDSIVTFTSAVSSVASSTTSFTPTGGPWQTNTVQNYNKNAFLGGGTFQVPIGGLSGGLNPVTWTANFTTNEPGVQFQWQWASAVYTSFSTNDLLGIKPVDDPTTAYNNSNHAGTPENFKADVTGGARGGGGSNWTGSYSSTASVDPSIVPEPSSILVLLCGIGGLGPMMRRRK